MKEANVQFKTELEELNTLYAKMEQHITSQNEIWDRIREIEQNIEFERKMES